MSDGQLELRFDAPAALDAKREGMARAERAERVQLWKRTADRWLATVEPGAEFTADDLVESIGLPDQGVARNNVVGAWFSGQARLGRIVFAGRLAKSARVIGHRNLQRVWRRT